MDIEVALKETGQENGFPQVRKWFPQCSRETKAEQTKSHQEKMQFCYCGQIMVDSLTQFED